ncbi:hypothetical protein JCM11641_001908 [Rhodosporidiobolus odoratus]
MLDGSHLLALTVRMPVQVFSKQKGDKAEYYQLSQFVCQYNAVERTVDCKPFVRTFLLNANKTMLEVTPTVNQGGRLPVSVDWRENGTSEPLVIPIGRSSPPPAS